MPATVHTFRHPSATHLIQPGSEVRLMQQLPGYSDVRTTMVDTDALNQGSLSVRSPADFDLSSDG